MSQIRAVGPPTRTPTPPGVLRRADDSVDPVYAARNEYKIVLAIMPLPASPMDTYTGFERPGTVTLRTRMEYGGEVAGQAETPDALPARCGLDISPPSVLENYQGKLGNNLRGHCLAGSGRSTNRLRARR
jgi:hypothetical protein